MREGLRPDLPPLPDRMRRQPVDARGYPVPWFVDWINGVPDFRIVDGRKLTRAIKEKLCWLCGEPLGRFGAFVIGPMCAINRTTSEPPCHRDCAIFGATACPFLTRPNAERRTANMPEGWQDPAGVMIRRNPGCSLIWITRTWYLYPVENGVLFELGEPTETLWYAEGREATREECERSIESGLPLLLADTQEHAPHEIEDAAKFLVAELEKVWKLMPAGPPADRSALEIVRGAMASVNINQTG